LELINLSLGGVGYIANQGKYGILYQVTSLQDLTNVIIPHFEKYPLITQKKADFELFKRVVDIMNRKGHLTSDGLQEIVNIRASINLGLSEDLKAAFPDTIPVTRPLVVNLPSVSTRHAQRGRGLKLKTLIGFLDLYQEKGVSLLILQNLHLTKQDVESN
jgi:hypothetical protein